MPLPNLANAELVAIAWVGSISGFTTQMVATQLPADSGTWAATGFVTVAVTGGTPHPLLPSHSPVMTIKCWATKPGSDKPPWWMAARIAQNIWLATMPRRSGIPVNRLLNLSAGGVAYPPAVVDSVTVINEPRRAYGDTGDYALYTLDAQFRWRSPSEVLN